MSTANFAELYCRLAKQVTTAGMVPLDAPVGQRFSRVGIDASTIPAAAAAAVRAVIGDQLRMPVMWCEMGSCVSCMPIRQRSAKPTPAPARSMPAGASTPSAGWPAPGASSVTPLLGLPPGRGAGPGHGPRQDRPDPPPCPATAPPAAPRCEAAVTPAALAAAIPGQPGGAGTAHDFPADEAHARWQISGKPGRYLYSLGVVLNPAQAWRAHGGRQAAPRQDSEHSEDLMVRERAGACPAGAMTSTGR
jgi:hypothetical protein